MNSYPKVSIITVVYNGIEFLEETIKSVIAQTYPNIEYIDDFIYLIKNINIDDIYASCIV